MKKILTFFMVVLLVIQINLIYSEIYAVENITNEQEENNSNIDLSFEPINENNSNEEENIELIIHLGKFTNIPEKSMMGYEAILDYDDEIFESVDIEGLNSWEINYSKTTKRMIGENLITGQENTDIAKITLKLNEGVERENTEVQLSDVLLTVNDNLDFEYTEKIPLTLTKAKEENVVIENKEKENNEINEVTTNETSIEEVNTITVKGEKEDQTTSLNKLPFTGLFKIFIVIGSILIIGIMCLAKYKSIKIK